MQPFNTKRDEPTRPDDATETLTFRGADELLPGACARLELSDGNELAVYNVGGEFYATENFCPHRGAPLTDGVLCGHIVECGWHGWQFDVRTGECLTVTEKLKTYRVRTEEGVLKVEI
ncbi:MAG TPA: Rieske 2Fe-2S domain-containing protein [Pyrinomonadaceae bacterium]